jgi:hypothetical protein
LKRPRIPRGRNLRILVSLSEEELAREGMRSERSPESLKKVLSLLAGHDLVRRRQIERIRRAVSGNQAHPAMSTATHRARRAAGDESAGECHRIDGGEIYG